MAATRPGALPEVGPAPRLEFHIEDGGTLEYAAAPSLRFALRIESVRGEPIRSIMLETQIQIPARRRSYDTETEERLAEVFGLPHQWASTLRTLPWVRTTQVVPPFTGSTVVDIPVPCTYDFEVTASKYLDAVRDGEVPIEFLFGGTFFYAGVDGRLQTGRIGWDQEAEYRLPVRVWRETMDRYFPDSPWLRLHRDTFDRLYAYKARNVLTSWESTIDSLLRAAGEEG